MKKIRIKKKTRNCCFDVFWSERFVVFIDTIYLHSYWCDSVSCWGSVLCWYPWQHRKDCPVTIILSKMCVLDFVVCCTSKPSCYLKKATALFKIVMVFWLSLIFSYWIILFSLIGIKGYTSHNSVLSLNCNYVWVVNTFYFSNKIVVFILLSKHR